MQTTLRRVEEEIQRAGRRYGRFTSSHEGYGVLAEEVAELLDAIRVNDCEAVWLEAIQVAAVAVRISMACDCEDFRVRSGFKK